MERALRGEVNRKLKNLALKGRGMRAKFMIH
jgi:hypothetical protein